MPRYKIVSPSEEQSSDMKITYGLHDSPFGPCLIGITNRHICKLAFLNTNSEVAARKELRETWPHATLKRSDTTTKPYIAQIFKTRSSKRPLPILLKGTDFQMNVWRALLAIPAGHITSYAKLAKAIGSPKASRAVGAACGANPIGYIVPCHRVLTADGQLGGYHWGAKRKAAMLAWEHDRR